MKKKTLFLRRFRPIYLFSFVTAAIYGFTLDIAMLLVGTLPLAGLMGKIIYYFVGMLFCIVDASLLFHTYTPPEAYGIFVKGISVKSKVDINIVKTVYDCCSCLAAIILLFAFLDHGILRALNLEQSYVPSSMAF